MIMIFLAGPNYMVLIEKSLTTNVKHIRLKFFK